MIKLEEVVRDRLIHLINFKGRVCLLHLFFAGNIFFFIKAKARDCKNLSKILQNFCDSSGQLMSVTKSQLWFSPSTTRHIKEHVASIFGIPTTYCIGTFRGRPIFTTHRTTNSYQYLVDKIQMRIEACKQNIYLWLARPPS